MHSTAKTNQQELIQEKMKRRKKKIVTISTKYTQSPTLHLHIERWKKKKRNKIRIEMKYNGKCTLNLFNEKINSNNNGNSINK